MVASAVRADGDVSVLLLCAIALVALVAGLALGWPSLVPVAIALACGGYAAELAIDDAHLDSMSPLIGAAVFLAAELAYWSIEAGEPVSTEPGESGKHAAFVALLGLGALLVGALLLALADTVHAQSLALDVTAAIAAAAALVVVIAGRGRSRGDA